MFLDSQPILAEDRAGDLGDLVDLVDIWSGMLGVLST